jgi:hypothetical protein
MFILSSTKLEIRAKQFLLGSEGVGGEGEKGRGGGQGEEMAQTLYAHMNKRNCFKIQGFLQKYTYLVFYSL